MLVRIGGFRLAATDFAVQNLRATNGRPYIEFWEVCAMEEREYTAAEYRRFIGELLDGLPLGFLRKIYSIIMIERKRAGV